MSPISRFAAVVAMATTVAAGTASAAPMGMSGPIQTSDAPFGVNHRDDIESFIENSYEPGSDITFLGRLRFNNQTNSFDNPLIYPALSLMATCNTPNNCRGGTWTLLPVATGFTVSHVEIVAAGIGQLYDVVPDALTGFWNTQDMLNDQGNRPQVRHLDFWGVPATVPEPAPLALLVAGTAGLLLLRRRRRV